MSYTFAQLRTALVAETFPDGEPDSLVTTHTAELKEAMVDLSRHNPCLQTNHVDYYPQCATLFRCGVTVLNAPAGRINRIYTVNADRCQKLDYRSTTFTELSSWSRGFMQRLADEGLEVADQTGLTVLPMGFNYPGQATDSAYGRALVGMWAIEKGKLYTAPWIQSDELVVIDWDGLKQAWADTDEVSDDIVYKRALKLWLQAQDHRRNGDEKAQMSALGEYAVVRAELIWECHQQIDPKANTRDQEDIEALENDTATVTVPEAAADANEISLAVIGDYGVDDTNEEAVADLVVANEPNHIITVGDNNLASPPNFAQRVGDYYAAYIFPYRGTPLIAATATENLFWPAIGNHDYDRTVSPVSLEAYLDFFTLPGNERYYDKAFGPVHLFFLNSNSDEPDGITSTSTQGKWLQKRMALSTAPWKGVVLHHPPFSSGSTHGSTISLQWPFAAWGANFVLAGHEHHYERLTVNAIPYIICGLGGSTLYGFGTPLATSTVRYNTKHGAVFMAANCTSLTLEALSVDEDVIDTVTLTK